jgi:hypothetical protein
VPRVREALAVRLAFPCGTCPRICGTAARGAEVITAEQVRDLTARVNELDDALLAAEKAGRVTEQVVLKRERANLLTELADLLRAAGRDDVGARLAARRDRIDADALFHKL